MQKYPSGSRGSPAKGVASVMVARVQISSSAPKKGHPKGVFFLAYRPVAGNRELSRVHARSEKQPPFISFTLLASATSRLLRLNSYLFSFSVKLLFILFRNFFFHIIYYIKIYLQTLDLIGRMFYNISVEKIYEVKK